MSFDNAGVKGWHPGEQAVQDLIHLPGKVSYKAITKILPEQHRIFHSSRLNFLPFTTLDDQGRPWASILCSKDGSTGYIFSPSETSLIINARVWDGDPLIENLGEPNRVASQKMLASGIGIELSTRRRNKFAGRLSSASMDGRDVSLHLIVSQALGLCPKYINIRHLIARPDVKPRVVYKQLHMNDEDRLPEDVINIIHSMDTAYLATSYAAAPGDEKLYPSHVGTNHRGGRPGFIRVRPDDGRTLVMPNYAGNRTMSSLGNIFVTPMAGFVFPVFSDGSVLYVTGTAQTLFGEASRQIMPSVNVITTIRVTGYILVENALPLREKESEREQSPYCPPVHYLAAEKPPEVSYADVSLTLAGAQVHNESLVTLTFLASRPIEIHASQNAVLDLSQFLRERSHDFVDWEEDLSMENDDCVRTWTVSIPPTTDLPSTFSITMRSINGGLVTPILYRLAAKLCAGTNGSYVDISSHNIQIDLRGIGGDIAVPEPIAACDGGRKLLWLAGGIGITPFLGLTRHVARHVRHGYGVWDIVLVVGTKEPDVMLDLIAASLGVLPKQSADQFPELFFVIHLFSSHAPTQVPPFPPYIQTHHHTGRLDPAGQFFTSVSAKERESHICGPLPFVQSTLKSMQAAGVDPESVHRERFTY